MKYKHVFMTRSSRRTFAVHMITVPCSPENLLFILALISIQPILKILPILFYSCTAWTYINATLNEQLKTYCRFFVENTFFAKYSFVGTRALYKMTSGCPLLAL